MSLCLCLQTEIGGSLLVTGTPFPLWAFGHMLKTVKVLCWSVGLGDMEENTLFFTMVKCLRDKLRLQADTEWTGHLTLVTSGVSPQWTGTYKGLKVKGLSEMKKMDGKQRRNSNFLL